MVYWRAKIGLICPGPAATIETDFHKYAPEGVGVSTMHIPWGSSGADPTPENLKAMVSGLADGCRGYIDGRLQQDVVIFGCTSGSLIYGPNYDQECIKVIEYITGAIGLTTSTAILQGLEALGARRVAVMTPYPEQTNEAERRFLEAHGYEVTTIVDINPRREYIPDLYPADVYRHAKALDKEGAEALFISCTGLDCLGMIPPMEEDFGMPVITSDQASLWASLRAARVGCKIPALGKLLTEF